MLCKKRASSSTSRHAAKQFSPSKRVCTSTTWKDASPLFKSCLSLEMASSVFYHYLTDNDAISLSHTESSIAAHFIQHPFPLKRPILLYTSPQQGSVYYCYHYNPHRIMFAIICGIINRNTFAPAFRRYLQKLIIHHPSSQFLISFPMKIKFEFEDSFANKPHELVIQDRYFDSPSRLSKLLYSTYLSKLHTLNLENTVFKTINNADFVAGFFPSNIKHLSLNLFHNRFAFQPQSLPTSLVSLKLDCHVSQDITPAIHNHPTLEVLEIRSFIWKSIRHSIILPALQCLKISCWSQHSLEDIFHGLSSHGMSRVVLYMHPQNHGTRTFLDYHDCSFDAPPNVKELDVSGIECLRISSTVIRKIPTLEKFIVKNTDQLTLCASLLNESDNKLEIIIKSTSSRT